MKLCQKVVFSLAIIGMCATEIQAAVTQVEGQAGGGIVPWGFLSGGEPTVSGTWVDTGDYTLSSLALQVGIAKWAELSYAKLTFDPGAPHPVGHINMDVLGAKIKLHDMDDVWPAMALGVQYKKMDGSDKLNDIIDAMGADDSGIDFYVAATKIMPVAGKKFLLNGTIRATKGNQIGILGFGSHSDDSYSMQLETSAGIFLNDKTVIGVEYRMKPDNNLTCSTTYSACPGNFSWKEDDWGDIFFAYFPSKNMAIVAAAAILGDIAPVGGSPSGQGGTDQRGLYLQIQANF